MELSCWKRYKLSVKSQFDIDLWPFDQKTNYAVLGSWWSTHVLSIIIVCQREKGLSCENHFFQRQADRQPCKSELLAVWNQQFRVWRGYKEGLDHVTHCVGPIRIHQFLGLSATIAGHTSQQSKLVSPDTRMSPFRLVRSCIFRVSGL